MKPFVALFGFLRSVIATKGRLVSLSFIGVVGVLIALAIGASKPVDPVHAATLFIAGYGMALVVPIVSLVFATATLGNLVEDNSLVYLWMRPTKRVVVAAASASAAWFVSVPLVVLPLVVSAYLAGGGTRLAVATVVASTLAVMAYSSVFVAIGLRFKRSLMWGLIYVLIWEGTVSQSASGASRLSIQTYANSALADLANSDVSGANLGLVTGIVVLIALSGVGVGFTTWLLNRGDVA